MGNSPGAQQNPQYCMLAGALNVSFDGGATWTPIGGGLSSIANNEVLGNVSGVSAVPIGLTAAQLAALVGPSLTPGTSDVYYKTRASSLLGTSNLASFYREFQTGVAGWTQNLVGASGVAQEISVPDSTDAVNSIGGICTFGTGSATNGTSELYRVGDGAAGLAPFLAFGNVNIKFYYATRFRMSSAVDANVACGVGTRAWLMGCYGANSTTKYSLRMGISGFHYLTSTVSIDTAFHIMETWHDGSTAWLSVDGETPVSVPDTAFWPIATANNAGPIFTFAKATAVATIYTGAVNWGLWCVKPIP